MYSHMDVVLRSMVALATVKDKVYPFQTKTVT